MLRLCARHGDRPERDAVAHHRDREDASKAHRAGELLMSELLIELDIGQMDHGAIEDRPARRQGPAGRGRQDATCEMVKRFWSPIVCRFEAHQLTIEADERAKNSVAQPRGALCHGVKHRLNIGRRARDNAQNIARGRLLLQGLLCLVEETDILDGDNGLVGERDVPRCGGR